MEEDSWCWYPKTFNLLQNYGGHQLKYLLVKFLWTCCGILAIQFRDFIFFNEISIVVVTSHRLCTKLTSCIIHFYLFMSYFIFWNFPNENHIFVLQLTCSVFLVGSLDYSIFLLDIWFYLVFTSASLCLKRITLYNVWCNFFLLYICNSLYAWYAIVGCSQSESLVDSFQV